MPSRSGGETVLSVSPPATGGPLRGPLSAAVAQLCERLRPQVGELTAAGLQEVLRRLAAPLQVAVAGRIKSGKSTLVNALIGRRVAPTDVGECTRLVTRFQYGTVDRVEVVFADGRRQALPFDANGMIPADLDHKLDEISHLEAYLTNAVLQDVTVIDTPGLGSVDDTSVARTQAVLDGELDPVSKSAVAGAEAVLYVVTQSVRADDQQVLAAFTAATASRDAGPVNAIAVLNKADTVPPESVVGAGDDVWKAATILAAKQADTLRPRVADVLPMVGLLAETAESGGFTSADADALRALAGCDETTRLAMLLSADLFTTMEAPVPTAVRQRLLERLDLHGVRVALDAIDGDPAITAGAIRRRLLDASGLAALRERIDVVFRARADGIKAAAALASITALAHASGDPGERQRVHDAIEVLLQKPQAHQLRLLEALTLVTSGAVAMPEDLAAEVVRVGGSAAVAEQLGMTGRPVSELAGYALERAGWWRSFASFGATPAQSRVAHVVHRAYFLIWQGLKG
jgi:GTPase Era involved in 16S rRNA processing